MELSAMLSALKQLQLEQYAYGHAMACLAFDSATVAPEGSADARGITLALLSEKDYAAFVNDDTRALLDGLWAKRDELDAPTLRQVTMLREQLDDMTRIPMEEYAAYSRLINDASACWRKAKVQNDYASFEPYLAQIIDYTCRFAGYKAPDRAPYDVLLDEYEKGMDMATLDRFFAQLRSEIVPLLGKVKPGGAPDGHCPIDVQRRLSSLLMGLMGLDPAHCVLAETEHPFTQGASKYDVRITTHYHEDAFLSSMYSVIHEGGHALYELGVADEYQFTVLTNMSTGVHESQSRFYENLVGRSAPFLQFLAPKLCALMGDHSWTADRLYRAANHVSPSLVRTEADEVTYPLHIMVRYELEKQLIGGTLSTRDLPEAWNALYKEYLGIDVPNDSLGVLQDMHWSDGMFGYFPTYALGSAYACQFMHAMRKDLDVDALLAAGTLQPITDWLRERIHRHGALYLPNDLILRVTGEPFDAKYYVQHLRNIVCSL